GRDPLGRDQRVRPNRPDPALALRLLWPDGPVRKGIRRAREASWSAAQAGSNATEGPSSPVREPHGRGRGL
ncbi:MAG: hypothetical protein AVDCRST_MAG10-274, partial [uncultured Acidimicrobiales bacterium]